ncbi:hypothetical protein GCM10023083_56260 [Streptomyces phyllanthi]
MARHGPSATASDGPARAIGGRVRAERERQKLAQEQVILTARVDRVTGPRRARRR